MNAYQLFRKDGTPHDIWCCEKCGGGYRGEAIAEACCKPKLCECGKPCEQGWTTCPECQAAKQATKERDRFAKAEKIKEDDWDSWVYLDGTGNDGFSRNTDELRECLEDESGSNLPEYVWSTMRIKFAQLDMDTVLEQITESEARPDDFDTNELIGLPDLEASIEAFNAANAHHVSHEADYSRAIIMDASPPLDREND